MKIDIRRGEVFEDYVQDYFEKRGWTVKKAKGNAPAFDLQITRERRSLLLEIKHDIKSDETGNYCLESKSLEQTQSDYLIIGTPACAYILPMEIAKQLFNKYPKRQTGDFAWNYSALVPKTAFINFQRL